MTLDMLIDSLQSVSFVSISCDSSNRGNKKMLPVMVRFFTLKEGIQCKLVELYRLDDETGETVFNKLKIAIEKFRLQRKLVSFGGDNCVTNFGGVQRGGDKNVYNRLQEEFGEHLVGVGCNAHLAHKAIEKACHKFQPHFDIEAIVVKIYGYFKNITVRNTRLRQLYSDDEDDIKLLGYSNTRFIGLKNCIGRILQYFDLLKDFFLNDEEDDAPIQLIRFFGHELAKVLLIFVYDQCKQFEKSIKQMEGSNVSGFEAAKQMKLLVQEIQSRRDEKFESLDLQQEMANLVDQLPFSDTITTKKNKKAEQTEVLIDLPYLQGMFQRFHGIKFCH